MAVGGECTGEVASEAYTTVTGFIETANVAVTNAEKVLDNIQESIANLYVDGVSEKWYDTDFNKYNVQMNDIKYANTAEDLERNTVVERGQVHSLAYKMSNLSDNINENVSTALKSTGMGDVMDETGPLVTTSLTSIPEVSTPEDVPSINTELGEIVKPDLSLPEDISDKLISINITPISEINIADFTEVAPTAEDPSNYFPTGVFSYNETGYSSDIVTQLENRMAELRDNNVGIPQEIWDAIWESGVERENEAVEQLIDEITIDMSSRGFTLPQGVQLARIDKARQDSLQKTITNSRELAIKAEEQRIKMFEFHVTQGIALEQIRGEWYNSLQSRLLEAAKFSFQSAIELFNARVQFFNAQVEIYKTKAEVYKISIETQIAKLEAEKTRLEAEKTTVEINRERVALYEAQIKAVGFKADTYKAEVEAEVAKLQAGKIKLEEYRAKTERLSANVNKAVNYELGKINIALERDKINSQNYQAATQRFSEKVQLAKSKVEADSTADRTAMELEKLGVQKVQQKIESLNNSIEALSKHIQSNLEISKVHNDADRVYIESEKTKVDAYAKSDQFQLDVIKSRLDKSLQGVQLQRERSKLNAQYASDRINALGQLYTGLASASLSAANISYGYSGSESMSCSTSYSA